MNTQLSKQSFAVKIRQAFVRSLVAITLSIYPLHSMPIEVKIDISVKVSLPNISSWKMKA